MRKAQLYHVRRRARATVRGRSRRRQVVATAPMLDVTGAASGLYRVADASLAGYLAYLSTDGAAIDFDAAAWAEAPVLNIPTPGLAAGHAYEIVVRRRNAYGLVSQNTTGQRIVIDGDGAETLGPPSAPTEAAATARAAGYVRLTAVYAYDVDGDAQADLFVVYQRTDGVDPDPGSDFGSTFAMTKTDGLARLTYDVSYPEGVTVRFLVRTRRSGTPDADSTNVDVHSATATFVGPDATGGTATYGGVYGQQQQL